MLTRLFFGLTPLHEVHSPPNLTNPSSCLNHTRWFAEEVHPHELALRNWLRVRFPALDDCDDLIQDTFLRAWRARARGPIDSVKPFLFAVARNLALDRLRDRQREIGLGEMDASSVLDESSDPADALVRAQELALLNNALESLPERCRQVFTLRRIHGLSQRGIAARLQISEKTVEAQNSIAMHKCVQFFERHAAELPRVRTCSVPTMLRAVGAHPQHA